MISHWCLPIVFDDISTRKLRLRVVFAVQHLNYLQKPHYHKNETLMYLNNCLSNPIVPENRIYDLL
jgi:hypothetical protein